MEANTYSGYHDLYMCICPTFQVLRTAKVPQHLLSKLFKLRVDILTIGGQEKSFLSQEVVINLDESLHHRPKAKRILKNMHSQFVRMTDV